MPVSRKRRRENRLSVTRVRKGIDWVMYCWFTYGPNVRFNALRWPQDRPIRTSTELHGRAELEQEFCDILVHRSLVRHEGHEAARLRIVECSEAVLIFGIHVDAVFGEFLDDLFIAFADRVM